MNPISNALTQGFSHQNILQYLLRHFPHARRQIEQALAKGFSAEKIVQFLQGGRKEVNNPITEHEQTRESHKEKQQNLEKGIAKGALAVGAAGLGAYALGRALPQSAQALTGQLLPALPGGSPQIGTNASRPQLPSPGQSPIQPPYNQGPNQFAYSNPSAQNAPVSTSPSPTIDITPPQPQTESKQDIPITSQAEKIAPLPEELIRQTSAMLEAGNKPEQIGNNLKALHPKIVKEYEKATGQPIRSAIEEFSKSLPKTEGQGVSLPAQTKVSETEPGSALGKFPNLKSITQNAKENITTTQEPKNLEPVSKELDVSKEKNKGKTVALPNGDIGEITDIRQGIATINSNGKEYRRKIEDLIESPIPEKDLAELHEELMKGIESKTGQEISRMVNWAGYDPKTNELAFVPHIGALYVYDNISPEDAKELTSLLSQRKTSGENFIGAWGQNTQSPIGASMSKLIQKLQKERGGKGSEYKGKYEKIYDALEPAKIASKQKFEEKQAIKREEKKSEKEKSNKEKENDKKRKAKKPRPD